MRWVAAHLDPAWRAHADPDGLRGWRPVGFDLGDGDTEVVATGAGPPLVLLPPMPGWKEAWVASAALLAPAFRVVTFDLRVRFRSGDRWAQWVADATRVMDAFATGRVTLAGHSLGGALALRLALAHPERIERLVLSSSFARVTTPPGTRARRFLEQPLVLASQRLLPARLALPLARRLAARSAWVYDPRCDERLLGFVRFAIRHARPAEVARLVRLGLELDVRGRLAGVAAPALVAVGSRERGFAQRAAEELARALPRAQAVTLPGVGHLHPLSDPAAIAGAIARFCGRDLPLARGAC